jgi:hypothetical protein
VIVSFAWWRIASLLAGFDRIGTDHKKVSIPAKFRIESKSFDRFENIAVTVLTINWSEIWASKILPIGWMLTSKK